jgi:hemerythrin-like domain-containing protein
MIMATATRTRSKTANKSATTSNGNNASNQNSNFGVLAGTAAAGAAIGVLAMLTRKAAVQAPSALAGNWDEALKLEHAAVMKVFDALEATDEKATMKRNMLLSHLKHALMKHAIEEENVIYPALREAGRKEEADQLNEEHGYVKQYLYDLENMPTAAPEWIAKVREFRAYIQKHVAEEENDLFPGLVAQLSDEKNKQLTLTMNKEGFKVA